MSTVREIAGERDDVVLLIGEAPNGPPTGRPRDDGPLQGMVGARLAEYADLTWGQYLVRTERHNLFQSPVGESWNVTLASRAAQDAWPSLLRRRTILLGSRVARAFGVRDEPLRWRTVDDIGTAVAVVPHPSGRNRWWNEPTNRDAARRFLRATFQRGA